MEASFAVESGSVLTSRNAGIVGISITVVLWFIASWRLLYHYSGVCGSDFFRRPSDDEVQYLRTDGLTTKRVVHVLLWITMVVEGVAYADMTASNTTNPFNYALLDVIGRGVLEFSTYIIVTIFWFIVTSRARAGASEKKIVFTIYPLILAFASIGMILSSTIEAVVLLSGDFAGVDDFRAKSQIHKVGTIIEASAWGVHFTVVSICCFMVYKRISSLPTFSQVRGHAKRNIVNKMMIPMICTALSYALRCGWMTADFVSRIHNPSKPFETGLGWWLGNVWIPTLVPCVSLLYSIRKRDREPGSIDGVSDALLHPQHPYEHNDPILLFHRIFRDMDEDDEE
mmetsp:Transcript_9539/g.18487  ORF Transcript_9539/g.18487 Transcript_9539/m.18487 type:complete len:341 (+) Transcript_9539:109-1131(+)